MYTGELSPNHVIHRTCNDLGIGHLAVTGKRRAKGKIGALLMSARVLVAVRLFRNGYNIREISIILNKNYHVAMYYLNRTKEWRT